MSSFRRHFSTSNLNTGDLPPWTTGRHSYAARRRRYSREFSYTGDIQLRAASLSSSPYIKIPPAGDYLSLLNTDLSLPILSATAAAASVSHSPDRIYFPHQPKSLSGIALRSFCLGIALTIGIIGTLSILILTSSPLWRLPFFLTALSTFHFLEFWTTAAYNTRVVDTSSFLLTANWPAYAIAHAGATLECFLTNIIWPNRAWAPFHNGPLLTLLGFALVIIGQTVRSVAMIQAGPSFNHIVQQRQSAVHVLVTTGIYGRLRHPSYFGFFWWALGTQLVLGNALSFCAYAAVLWHFFSSRIRHEEEFLVQFFDKEYVDYRKKVGTKIPFVP